MTQSRRDHDLPSANSGIASVNHVVGLWKMNARQNEIVSETSCGKRRTTTPWPPWPWSHPWLGDTVANGNDRGPSATVTCNSAVVLTEGQLSSAPMSGRLSQDRRYPKIRLPRRVISIPTCQMLTTFQQTNVTMANTTDPEQGRTQQ